MTSWYPKAIEELAKITDSDAKAVLFRIAQKRPKAIVDACAPAPAPALKEEPKWVDGCRQLVLAGHKIDAIKLWRNSTGVALKEAKEAVESRFSC